MSLAKQKPKLKMEIRLSWALIALALLAVLGCSEGRDMRAKRQSDDNSTEREAKKLLVDGFIVSNKKRVREGQPDSRWVGCRTHR